MGLIDLQLSSLLNNTSREVPDVMKAKASVLTSVLVHSGFAKERRGIFCPNEYTLFISALALIRP